MPILWEFNLAGNEPGGSVRGPGAILAVDPGGPKFMQWVLAQPEPGIRKPYGRAAIGWYCKLPDKRKLGIMRSNFRTFCRVTRKEGDLWVGKKRRKT